ncbi:chaperone modulator CbpM [Luteolibacter flavescens]|uniref:Chaperone modulator CbpM n=1 Tax=Luteolibacter flavescens TaxID=1859460 RepID=A0ABT3FP09_9BACT|nr:chaperone modulator CbpM [Luteolibacter flavescens]MCW1884725.1 chaperone modulator CbpM [Luteolibacter flavescens]
MSTPSPTGDDLVDLDTAARLCGLPAETILEYSRTEVITVTSSGEGSPPAFDAVCLHRLRRIEALHHEWSMPPGSVGLVMGLLDRLEAAERELRAMRERQR